MGFKMKYEKNFFNPMAKFNAMTPSEKANLRQLGQNLAKPTPKASKVRKVRQDSNFVPVQQDESYDDLEGMLAYFEGRKA